MRFLTRYKKDNIIQCTISISFYTFETLTFKYDVHVWEDNISFHTLKPSSKSYFKLLS